MLGLNPFDAHRGFHPRRTAPAAPRREPYIETKTTAAAYLVGVSPPAGSAIKNPSAEPMSKASILVEGALTDRAPRLHEYVVRARHAPVYASPSRSAIIAYAPHGAVVTGSAPSRAGWIALDEEEEAYMLDDGSLATRTPQAAPPTPFAKRVDLPVDADLSNATVRRGGLPPSAGEPGSYEVCFSGGRVAIRAGTHTNAAILGALSRGDVVSGIVDDVDENWIRLPGVPSGHNTKQAAYVMIEHPTHGRLLRPVGEAEEKDGVEGGAFVIEVPRRKLAPPPAKRQPAANKRPAAAQPTAAAAPSAAPKREAAPPRPAAVAAAAASGGEATTTRAGLAAERRAAKERLGGVSTVEALSVEASSVLSECAPSDENVQSPREEEEEAWVAVEGGGFEKAPRV